MRGYYYQLRCLLTNLVISNIETCFFPSNTAKRCSSALIFLLSFASWRLFFFIYSHSFLVIFVLGSGSIPTILASAALGFTAFINAGLGDPFFVTFLSFSVISVLLMLADSEA